MTIPVDKIGEVIGPKGKVINSIQEDTGAEITIEDDGTIYVGAMDGPCAEAARSAINSIANPQMPEVGERYLGTVVKTTNFGAFISLLPGKDGLLHIRRSASSAGQARRTSKMCRSARRCRSRSPRSTAAASCLIPVEVVELRPPARISAAAARRKVAATRAIDGDRGDHAGRYRVPGPDRGNRDQ